jgi:drug/metabolite transporter (DMT)-like permease
VAGYLTFALGARDAIAVTAVLASQFAVLAAIGAHVLGERLAPRQWAGVGVVAFGVAAVTLLRV